jgi:hypothetical protein
MHPVGQLVEHVVRRVLQLEAGVGDEGVPVSQVLAGEPGVEHAVGVAVGSPPVRPAAATRHISLSPSDPIRSLR